MTVASGISCIPDMARAWSSKTPDKAALIDPERVVTYAQLDDRSNRIADTLIAAGVRPGSHVGYLGKNSAAFFEIWVGANKAGCALAPLNWRSAPAELTEVVHDAKVPVIFAGREFAELADRVREAATITAEVIREDDLDEWISAAGSSDPGIAVMDSSTALLAYTSGTTAAPKGVQISHGALQKWFRAVATEPSVNWNSDDIGLMVMPNFHLAGSLMSLPALYHGASLTILPAFEPSAFVDAVVAHRPTVTCLVPTAIQMLLDHKSEQPANFTSLRRILYAGSPIGQHTLQQALEKFGCDFVQFYGTTETFIITLLRPEQHRVDNPDLLKSCGQPMPGVELRIVDAGGHDLPPGETGEVLVLTVDVQRLLEQARGDRHRDHRRLVSHRRCRQTRRGGQPLPRRPPEGHDRQRWREHLLSRGRTRLGGTSIGAIGRRGRCTRRKVGRTGGRLRCHLSR
jgi:acyl-CoA synthetase (AMP-forming)/AMP-acid ligase II